MSSHFIQVPKVALRARGANGKPLADGAKLLLGLIVDYANRFDEPFPAIGTLAEELGKSPATVKRHLRELESAGAIVRHLRSMQTTVYEVTKGFRPVKRHQTEGGQYCTGGGSEMTPGGGAKMTPESEEVLNHKPPPTPSTANDNGGGKERAIREADEAIKTIEGVYRQVKDREPQRQFSKHSRRKQAYLALRVAEQRLPVDPLGELAGLVFELIQRHTDGGDDLSWPKDVVNAIGSEIRTADFEPPRARSESKEARGGPSVARTEPDTPRPTRNESTAPRGALRKAS